VRCLPCPRSLIEPSSRSIWYRSRLTVTGPKLRCWSRSVAFGPHCPTSPVAYLSVVAPVSHLRSGRSRRTKPTFVEARSSAPRGGAAECNPVRSDESVPVSTSRGRQRQLIPGLPSRKSRLSVCTRPIWSMSARGAGGSRSVYQLELAGFVLLNGGRGPGRDQPSPRSGRLAFPARLICEDAC